ncbi:MAG: uracil-DNA glycosylase [Methanolinea sp.]|nr:uracil-DNA glycosylase [Methanolinea sp.]
MTRHSDRNTPSAMSELEREICSCQLCDLAASRTLAVPGEGPSPSRLLLIGEGPGRKEDETGRPFVGRAGTILTGLLLSAGLMREEVFITSIVKCRPPANRAPKDQEIDACMPYLKRQIAILSPRFVVPMGNTAIKTLFRMYGLHYPSLAGVRGRVFRVHDPELGQDLRIVPVYHPAVVTHNPPSRGALESDFRRLEEFLREEG